MAQLAYHVSTGTPMWNFEVKPATVLYLALEDDYARLQSRFYRMFGTDSADNLHFSTVANSVNGGLENQLRGFIEAHKETKLIIIDTLQKVREKSKETYSYANDYQIIARLKAFASAYGICLMLVHHTRKQQADDKFDMISRVRTACSVRLTERLCYIKRSARRMRLSSKSQAEISRIRNYILQGIKSG